MKPTDKKHPIEISTQSTPEAPVISRLKRVIDIKSLEPSKTQTTHHSSNTRDNRKSASRPAPKHTDSNHARSDSNHVRSSIRKQASDAVSPVKPKDAGTFSHAATPQTVPAKDPLSPKQRVKVTPKRSDSDHTAAVSPAAPSKPATSPIRHTVPSITCVPRES